MSVGGIGLHLRGEVREIWFDWLREHRPDLLPRYEELYERGAYMQCGRARAAQPDDQAGRRAARAVQGKGPGSGEEAAAGATGDDSAAEAVLIRVAITAALAPAHAAATQNAAE